MVYWSYLLQVSPSTFPLPSTFGEGLLILFSLGAITQVLRDKKRSEDEKADLTKKREDDLDKRDAERTEHVLALKSSTDAMKDMASGMRELAQLSREIHVMLADFIRESGRR